MMKHKFSIYILFTLLGIITATNDYQTALPAVKSMLNKLDILSILTNTSLDGFANTTKECIRAYKGLGQMEFLQYLDADGKPPSGLFTGDLFWLGNYKQCISLKTAHYCNIGKVKITALKQFVYLGMCVPNECDVADIVDLLKYISNLLASKNVHIFTVEENYALESQYNMDSVCYDKEKQYSTGAIVMIVITSIIGLLCLLGTVTDRVLYYIKECRTKSYVVYVEKDEAEVLDETVKKTSEENVVSMHQVKVDKDQNTLIKFLLCFSLIKNTASLFDTRSPPGAITSVNGIRTLSIMWVILGHTLVFALGATSNVLDVSGWLPRFTMQAILNAPVSVDSFFVLSGLLVSYLSLKRFQSTGTLPLLRYYLHRYIRLTPSYAYLIFFLAYLYPVLSDGPLWYMQGPNSNQSENCKKYWWTNLLYINNFYPKQQQDMCFNWSWYLANDMQFYVITPIILYAMYKMKWIGVVAADGIFLLACFICNGVLMHTEHASPLFYDGKRSALSTTLLAYMQYLYMKPYTRISPYLVGLVLGYILINKKVLNGKGSQQIIFYTIGWIAAVGMGLAVVYGPYSTTDYKWEESSFITYGILFRFVWAIALSWVIYACHNGYGGLVNDMMSWSAFIPLSRLTYATYLVHPMVIFLFYFSTSTGVNLTLLSYSFFFVGVTTISFALAYIVAVCIEYPVFNLEKLILKF